jgi:hypothetical protein
VGHGAKAKSAGRGGLAGRLLLALAADLALEGLGRGLTPLHSTKTGFNPLGELLAGLALQAFHQLFHATIGPDAEADGMLGHPEPEAGMGGC